MNTSFGKATLSSSGITGWPADAAWLWLPLCFISGVAAYIYMSNQPNHGSKRDIVSLFHCKFGEKLLYIDLSSCLLQEMSLILYLLFHTLLIVYWMEIMGFLASFLSVITFILTRNTMNSTAGERIGHVFLLILLAAFCSHFFILFSPKKARNLAKKQSIIFKNKHTYIMTWLYIMR